MPAPFPATNIAVIANEADAFITVGWTALAGIIPTPSTAKIEIRRRKIGTSQAGLLVHTDDDPLTAGADTAKTFNDYMAPLETDLEYSVDAFDDTGDEAPGNWTA